MSPLHKLLSSKKKRAPKSAPLVWTEEALVAFADVKSACQDPQVLGIPDLSKQFFMRCDASGIGYGGVLLQCTVEGVLRPIEFFSGVWKTKKDKQAPARVLELKGMLLCMKHWSHFVRGKWPLHVLTDHKSLSQAVRPQTHDNDEVRNLVGELKTYYLVVEYIPGKDNWLADLLSRPCVACIGSPCIVLGGAS
jgi:hypothetical protein